MFKKQNQEAARRVSRSVIFAGDYGFALSGADIWRIPAGCTLPKEFLAHTEIYDGPIPHDAKTFDPEEFERLTHWPACGACAPRDDNQELGEPTVDRARHRSTAATGKAWAARAAGFPPLPARPFGFSPPIL